MITFKYYLTVLLSKIKRDKHKETITRWFAKQGVQFPKGGPVYINCNIAKNEPHLISIGKNTTLAGGVELITHDNSISKVISNTTDLFGKISIGDNCFIGAKSIILYGVTIPNNVIVAAGSVVTKSIKESRVIIAGNPAKKISTWDDFYNKYYVNAWNLNEVSRAKMVSKTLNGEKIVKR